MKRALLVAALLLTSRSALAFTGICDALSTGCAEAWAVDHPWVGSYTGPLFQLWNGAALLNVGQTSASQADMSTWSAFCGGVTSNCKYAKIYAEIHGHADDLVPSVFVGGANCSGGPYACAAPFAISTETGLPIVGPTTRDGMQAYTLANDASVPGVALGGNSVSVLAYLPRRRFPSVFGVCYRRPINKRIMTIMRINPSPPAG